jgi:hypothetical protein
MRLMRAWMTRGTAAVTCVTSRSVRAWLRTAAGRLHPAAGPPPETPHVRRGFSLRHLAAGPPRTGGYGRPSWSISRWPCPRRLGREDVSSASGPASLVLTWWGRSVGGLGPGLTSESADAARAVLITICRPGPRFMAPTGAAGLICLAWARGRDSQVRAASECVPSLNLRKG